MRTIALVVPTREAAFDYLRRLGGDLDFSRLEAVIPGNSRTRVCYAKDLTEAHKYAGCSFSEVYFHNIEDPEVRAYFDRLKRRVLG
jgi:hypothetical protein